MKKIVLLVLLVLSLGIRAYAIEDKVVAVVNNEVITKAELDTYINLIKMQLGDEGWQKHGITQKDALDNLIENKLIIQEAKNRKIQIDERAVESQLSKMKKRFLSEEDFIDFLSTQGLSLTEFRDYLKDQMLNEILINAEIKSRIIISPSEVTKYYESHAADFYFPERARVESIFVNNENTAREVYRKLQSGADFAELRKGYSKRTDLGVVAKGQLRKEIEDVIFNLGVGKFSRPFETSEGYYIFLVKEKIPPSQRALIEVQPTVYDKIWQDKFNAKFKGFMQELKDKAFVQIKYEQ